MTDAMALRGNDAGAAEHLDSKMPFLWDLLPSAKR